MIFGSQPLLSPLAFRFSEDKYCDWDVWKNACIPRLKHASGLGVLHIKQAEPNQNTCVIVGAGPTVSKYIGELRDLSNKSDYDLCAINKVHDFLIKKDIIPKFHVIFENDIENVEQALGGPPHKDVIYYVSSNCHENVFRQLHYFKVVLWHPTIDVPEYLSTIKDIFPDEPMIGGDAGHITFFRSFAIAYLLGCRKYELYGIDSSFEESDHIQGYEGSDVEPILKVWGRKKITGEMRAFKTNATLAFQAYRFIFMCDGNPDLKIRVHGDSLIRFIHQGRFPEQYVGYDGSV